MWSSGQFKSKGGIVNIPVSVDTSVSYLPRTMDDTRIVHVKLARKLSYKTNYRSGSVRPAMVWNAAEYLCGKPLYQRYGIHLTENNWFEEVATAINIFNNEAENENNDENNTEQNNREGNYVDFLKAKSILIFTL